MKTLRLSLTTSDGHPVEVPYTLPESVRFDCFVPEYGVCVAYVDVSAEEVLVTEVHRNPGVPGRGSLLPESLCTSAEVIEQAGDVCALFDDAGFMGTKPGKHPHAEPDAKLLTIIADVARHELALRYAWGCIPPILRTGNYPPDTLVPQYLAGTEAPNMDSRSVRVLHAFIHTTLVERAQEMATKAAKARQQAWEAKQAEHLREERCDARDEVAP